MRAFTIMLAVAMVGAVSLATMGAVWTVSQTRHNAVAFSFASGSALARNAYRGRPALAGASLARADTMRDGAVAARDQGLEPFDTADR